LDRLGQGEYNAPVAVVALWRWVLRGLLSNPVLGVVWLLFLGLPLLQGLAFLPSSRGARELAFGWSFPAALVGTGSGLAILSRGAPFLARLAPTTRFPAELGALVLAALYLQLPVLMGVFLGTSALHKPGFALAAILTADCHLAGIALFLLLPTLSTPVRVSFFLALAWLVPALCSAGGVLRRAGVWVDAAAALRGAPDGFRSACAAATALVLAAYLLRTRPTPAPLG
jgi:hypothetical protein